MQTVSKKTQKLNRRNLLHGAGLLAITALLNRIGLRRDHSDWRDLLPLYEEATRKNIVTVNGRRALLSAWVYPGTYIRDSMFWGPLALRDMDLGYECYQWFAETQMESGQILSAVPLHAGEVDKLDPKDDEGGLIFVIASGWLHRGGYEIDFAKVELAYRWVQDHVHDDLYISLAGNFRYWADTVSPDTDEVISHNQGLLCLARRAMLEMGLGGVGQSDVDAAVAGYRLFYTGEYIRLGLFSRFADTLDNSAIFPDFLSRFMYDEGILSDEMIVSHTNYLISKASVPYPDGRLAGIKIISGKDGEFLPPEWFDPPQLNEGGEYQNGGYWPMYTLIDLAMAYRITGDSRYEQIIGTLVVNELGDDPRSKEIMRLSWDGIGGFDANRTNYTWNALIKTACEWCGLA